jgi:hypothetical protein
MGAAMMKLFKPIIEFFMQGKIRTLEHQVEKLSLENITLYSQFHQATLEIIQLKAERDLARENEKLLYREFKYFVEASRNIINKNDLYALKSISKLVDAMEEVL